MQEPAPQVYTSRCLDCVVTMPPLSHWRDRDQEWTPDQSDVARWLVTQPDVVGWVMQIIRDRGLIKFDPETKLWVGRDFNKPTP